VSDERYLVMHVPKIHYQLPKSKKSTHTTLYTALCTALYTALKGSVESGLWIFNDSVLIAKKENPKSETSRNSLSVYCVLCAVCCALCDVYSCALWR
jgi:hypothetical protein